MFYEEKNAMVAVYLMPVGDRTTIVGFFFPVPMQPEMYGVKFISIQCAIHENRFF